MKTSLSLLAAKIVACVALGLAAAGCQKAAEAPAPAASPAEGPASAQEQHKDADAVEARQQPSEPAADTVSPSNAPPPPPAH